MGGLDTEVTDATTRVLLESASFRAARVRRTARRLGLHSEASHRFERGVDPGARGARVGARGAPDVPARRRQGRRRAGRRVSRQPRRPATIAVRLPRVRMLTGVPLDAADVPRRARAPRLRRRRAPASTLDVTPPSARADVAREVDVIEEILRVVGYEQVTSTLPALRQAPGVRPADRGRARARGARRRRRDARRSRSASSRPSACAALGVAGDRSARAADRDPQPDERRPGGDAHVAAAEPGRRGRAQPEPRPPRRRAVRGRQRVPAPRRGRDRAPAPRARRRADCGPRACSPAAARRRSAHGTPWDVFDAKALALVAIRAVAGARAACACTRPCDASRTCTRASPASSSLDGAVVGWFGEVHPDVRARLGVEGAGVRVRSRARRAAARGARRRCSRSRGSRARRATSRCCSPRTIPAARVERGDRRGARAAGRRVRLLEDYRDAKLGDGMKSMLWSIAYRVAGAHADRRRGRQGARGDRRRGWSRTCRRSGGSYATSSGAGANGRVGASRSARSLARAKYACHRPPVSSR